MAAIVRALAVSILSRVASCELYRLQAAADGEEARQAASERLEELRARTASRQRLLSEEQVRQIEVRSRVRSSR